MLVAGSTGPFSRKPFTHLQRSHSPSEFKLFLIHGYISKLCTLTVEPAVHIEGGAIYIKYKNGIVHEKITKNPKHSTVQ